MACAPKYQPADVLLVMQHAVMYQAIRALQAGEEIVTIAKEANLLEHPENEEVSIARDTYASIRQQCLGLLIEVYTNPPPPPPGHHFFSTRNIAIVSAILG